MTVTNENSSPWWAKSLADAAHEIDASTEGLSSRQAAQRLRRYVIPTHFMARRL